MPGKMIQCTSCSKTMRSDNLRRHARSCKNINSHNSHRLPGYGVGNHLTRRLTDTSIADEDDTSSGDESAKDSVDGKDLIYPDINSIGDTSIADEDDTSSGDESAKDSVDCEDLIYPDTNSIGLWERLAILCIIINDSELPPFDIFKEYVSLYMQSESDELFNEIMNDIMDAKLRDVPLRDAITYALKENEGNIIASVEMCHIDESFWCHLAEMGGGWDCRFLTGEPCHCTECKGLSMQKMMANFIRIFYDMRGDRLIQQIEYDIDEMGEYIELDDRVNQVADKYHDDVLVKLNNAKNNLDTRGWSYLCFA